MAPNDIASLQEDPHVAAVRGDVAAWQPAPVPPGWVPSSADVQLIRSSIDELRSQGRWPR